MTNLIILSQKIRYQDGLYSLNDLHKCSGNAKKHQPNQFLRNEQAQQLVYEINRSANSRIAFETKRGGKNQGTWVCKELVYAYAMWISAKFHLQVIRAFDQLVQAEYQSRPAVNGFDYARMMLTIEKGRITSCYPVADEAFLTSPDSLPTQLREMGVFTPNHLQVIAGECLGRLVRLAK